MTADAKTESFCSSRPYGKLDLPEDDILQQLIEKYELSREEAETYLKKTN